MNKYFLISLLILASLFSSCSKQDLSGEIGVNLKSAGILKVILKDAEGTPIANQKLSIYYSYYEGSLPLLEMNTNDEGIADFGEIISSNYVLIAEEVEDGGVEYNVTQPLQVIGGSTKELSLVPSTYSAKLRLNVFEAKYDYGSWTDKKGLTNTKVAIVPNNSYSSFENIMESAIMEGELGSSNTIVFEKVPVTSYQHYEVLIYKDKDNFGFASIDEGNGVSSNVVAIDKGEDVEVDAIVNTYQITEHLIDVNIEVSNYYESTKNAEVFVVLGDFYPNNFDYSYYKENAYKSKRADDNGDLLLQLPVYREMVIVAFDSNQSMIDYYWGSFYSDSSHNIYLY